MTMAAMALDQERYSSSDWRLINAVKDRVTTRDAALQYGIQVGRNGMCRCPFHNDKNPSMKVDKRYHCFGCQADGDVISFTSRLFGFNRKAAAYKLAADFGVHAYEREGIVIPLRRKPVSEEEKIEHCAAHYYRELCDYRNTLAMWRDQYAPKTPDDDFHPRFVEALQNLSFVENDLDILLSGDLTEKKLLVEEIQQKRAKEVNTMDSNLMPVYYGSGAYARDHKELELFRASHMENINCKKAIEASIARNFDGIRLNRHAVDGVLDTYGSERVAMVLAATIQTKSWDGRFSPQNKDWAFTIQMPDSQPEAGYDRRDAYAVTSHPAVLDGFINLARKEIQERSRASVREELKMPAISTPNPVSRPKEMER